MVASNALGLSTEDQASESMLRANMGGLNCLVIGSLNMTFQKKLVHFFGIPDRRASSSNAWLVVYSTTWALLMTTHERLSASSFGEVKLCKEARVFFSTSTALHPENYGPGSSNIP